MQLLVKLLTGVFASLLLILDIHTHIWSGVYRYLRLRRSFE